jgi:hypothetical protein
MVQLAIYRLIARVGEVPQLIVPETLRQGTATQGNLNRLGHRRHTSGTLLA